MRPGREKAEEAPEAQFVVKNAATDDVDKSKAHKQKALGGQQASPQRREDAQQKARDRKDA